MGRPLALSFLLVGVLAGCSDPAPTTSELSDWGFAPTLVELAEEARAAGASEEQVHQLEAWIEIEDTPYSDLEQALQRTFACFEQAGLEYSYGAPAGGEDYPEVKYAVFDDSPAGDHSVRNLIDACESKESQFVSMAYQLGPGVTARRERDNAAFFPQAIACLDQHGVETPEVSTLGELETALLEAGVDDPWGCTAPPYTSGDL